MIEPLPDELLDSIVVEPVASGHRDRSVGVITGPAAAWPVTVTLKAFPWVAQPNAARGVARGVGMEMDDAGFSYPGDLDPDEEPVNGVLVYNPLGRATVSVAAFERLMLRYFRALIAGAERFHDSVIREPWWPEFVAATEEIEARVSPA